ncbi:hypothetical protein C2S52_001306 [Perilla frutescens var. hirtella]|nr:hypothetical protein C2S51_007177 [Perilla frutescens var. frutescens]KAH6800842.1 hypothetical protein C2S52_001306 [Perilla frutescens var. hirtella]
MRGAEIIIPPFFRCPISLDLFKDPVTLWTGQTYDRSCIEKWLAAGNLTCPVTMQKLQDSTMVPNHTLRHLIDDWLHSNGYSETDSLDDHFSENQISIARIKHIIDSDEFALENKVRALEEAYFLSQELPLKNSCLIELEFFRVLIQQVFENVEGGRLGFILVEKALLCALRLMPFSDLSCLNMLKQESKYAAFLFLFEQGSIFIKKSLCRVVEAIFLELKTKQLCEKLGKSARLARAMLDLVQQQRNYETAEAGMRALSAVSLMESNRKNIVSQGGVEGLIEYLTEVETGERRCLAAAAMAMAMSTIENLLSETSAKEALLNHPSGVKAVVKMVFRVSEVEGSESAVNSLLNICSDSETAREKVVADGVLTKLLLLLQSQCSGTAKNKARMLLKLLRSK